MSERFRGVTSVMHLATVARAPEPLIQLGESQVEGGVRVSRGRLTPHHGSPAVNGELDPVSVRRLARVLLLADHRVYAVALRTQLLDLLDLLLEVATEPVGHCGVPGGHGDVHGAS